MKITNHTGLPMPIVKAVENDPYDNGDTLSATTLLKPAQARRIMRDHADELSEDAADRIWALMGQLGHSIIERAAVLLDPKEWITERRWYGEHFGERVSAAADLIHVADATVFDWKFTSVWAAKDAIEGGKSDWRYQLSMLAMLAREGRYMEKYEDAFGLTCWRVIDGPPIEVRRGKIVAVLRDWSKNKARQSDSYPQQQVVSIDMDIMSDEETRAWLKDRIELHNSCLVDGVEVLCTDEERWKKPGQWAVTKVGNSRAAKVANTEDELSAWIFANRSKLGAAYEIEERPAEYKRCADYCAAAPFCKQFQSSIRADDGDGIEMPETMPYKPQTNERY